MVKSHPVETLYSQLQEASELSKCKKCGCMKETLEAIIPSLSLTKVEKASQLLELAKTSLSKMEPTEYT